MDNRSCALATTQREISCGWMHLVLRSTETFHFLHSGDFFFLHHFARFLLQFMLEMSSLKGPGANLVSLFSSSSRSWSQQFNTGDAHTSHSPATFSCSSVKTPAQPRDNLFNMVQHWRLLPVEQRNSLSCFINRIIYLRENRYREPKYFTLLIVKVKD